MNRKEILEHLRTQPFQPFRIRMSNGESYEIKHPENAHVLVPDSLYIFEPVQGEPGADELVTIASIQNIRSIEKPIDSAA